VRCFGAVIICGNSFPIGIVSELNKPNELCGGILTIFFEFPAFYYFYIYKRHPASIINEVNTTIVKNDTARDEYSLQLRAKF
jgi:hypothetical protein